MARRNPRVIKPRAALRDVLYDADYLAEHTRVKHVLPLTFDYRDTAYHALGEDVLSPSAEFDYVAPHP